MVKWEMEKNGKWKKMGNSKKWEMVKKDFQLVNRF